MYLRLDVWEYQRLLNHRISLALTTATPVAEGWREKKKTAISPQSTMPHTLHTTSSTSLGTAAGSYIYTLASASTDILAAASSDDSLRLFSPSTLAARGCVAHAHDGITCLVRVGENVLATAGRDGCVRVWDVRDGGAAAAGVFRSGLWRLSVCVCV